MLHFPDPSILDKEQMTDPWLAPDDTDDEQSAAT
jgi:hypothetical protein